MNATGCGCGCGCGRRGSGPRKSYYEELHHPASPSFSSFSRRAKRRSKAPASPRQHRRRRSSCLVAVRRAVVRVAEAGAARRRRCTQWAAALWGKLRLSLRWAVPSLVSSLPGKKKSMAAYDVADYSRNFDDGAWREEDDDFWRGGRSFAFRFSKSGRYAGETVLE